MAAKTIKLEDALNPVQYSRSLSVVMRDAWKGRESLTAQEVAGLDIGHNLRIKTLIRMLDDRQKRLWACYIAERCAKTDESFGHGGGLERALAVSRLFAEGAAADVDLSAARILRPASMSPDMSGMMDAVLFKDAKVAAEEVSKIARFSNEQAAYGMRNEASGDRDSVGREIEPWAAYDNEADFQIRSLVEYIDAAEIWKDSE